jgi:ATP/maltotriose-dependent transcriptional regulator MalT
MLPRHIYNAFPLLTQAYIRLQRDDGKTAEQVAAEALEILRNGLPESHFAIGIAKCLVGEARLLQGELQEAADLLSSALPIAAAGPENLLPYVANCRNAQASAAVAIGAPEAMAAP